VLIAFIFVAVILPALGWGWYDYAANQVETSGRKSLMALCLTSLSSIGFVGTTFALTHYGNTTDYFRIAVGGALLACGGSVAGAFVRPFSKMFLLGGIGVVILLFWLMIAIVVMPVS
jgi:hypothetical protein